MDENLILDTQKALDEIRSYDLSRIPRQTELGPFNFSDSIEPAQKAQDLFNQIPAEHVSELSESHVNTIKRSAQDFLQLLAEIQAFDAKAAANPTDEREALASRVKGTFETAYNALHSIVAYLATRQQDLSSIIQEIRESGKLARKEAAELIESLAEQKNVADQLVEDVKAAAAEEGVGRQAIHFKAEADDHKIQADNWRICTIVSAVLLIAYSMVSLFFVNIESIRPDNMYETAQLAVSKFLIFAVLAYLVIISAKNFLSHKHNEIVNRHRQNALATFTALAEATSDAASRDIVLSHAAACIFSPQETGYAKQDSAPQDLAPTLQITPRIGAAG